MHKQKLTLLERYDFFEPSQVLIVQWLITMPSFKKHLVDIFLKSYQQVVIIKNVLVNILLRDI